MPSAPQSGRGFGSETAELPPAIHDRLKALAASNEVLEVRLAELEQIQIELLQAVDGLQGQLADLSRRQRLDQSQVAVIRSRLDILRPSLPPRPALPEPSATPAEPDQPEATLHRPSAPLPASRADHPRPQRLRSGLLWLSHHRPRPVALMPSVSRRAIVALTGCTSVIGLALLINNSRVSAWWLTGRLPAASPVPVASASPRSAASAKAGAATLRLRASDTTWLEVEDAAGRVLHYGTMDAGERAFPVSPSLRIRAGRPDLIRVQYGSLNQQLGGVNDTDWRIFRLG